MTNADLEGRLVRNATSAMATYYPAQYKELIDETVSTLTALRQRVEALEGVLRDATDFVDDAWKRWPVGSLERENVRNVLDKIEAALEQTT